MLGVLARVGVEGKRRLAVGPGGAAQAQIDAPGGDGFQHAELFGHFQRRVMGQHDPGRPDADAVRRLGDGGHDDFRRRADDRRMVVMFRYPEPGIAQVLAMLGEGDGVADRLIGGLTLGGGGLVEDGKLEHGGALRGSVGGAARQGSRTSLMT